MDTTDSWEGKQLSVNLAWQIWFCRSWGYLYIIIIFFNL